MPRRQAERVPLSTVTRRYDRVARHYRAIEPLFLIFPIARRKAAAALGLRSGDTVLEIGAGTGRNLPYLVEGAGPAGRVIALDASGGMLAEARRLVGDRGWENVELVEGDAAKLDVAGPLDAVLFSLSYSVIPDPAPALARAWERLRPGGRVVVMDVGIARGRLGRLLGPIARLLVKLAPGDPYSDPWSELGKYGQVETERFLLGLYYVASVGKPEP